MELLSRNFAAHDLFDLSVAMFRHFSVPDRDAHEAATVLQAADLSGIDSHGVARLRTYYDMLRLGRINPRPKLRILRESASTATVDGDNGLGLVVGPQANRIAHSKALEAGTGWVSVCNSNHYGIAGHYVRQGLDSDIIGWAMTNSTKLVTPLWGAERMLGTNPIAIAFPGALEPPIVIDMASCTAAYGKVEIAARERSPLPSGWVVDQQGEPTRDCDAMAQGGALLPLGSTRDQGGHKGYALALMVDVLCAVLSGANWGPFTPPFALQQEMPRRSVGRGIGHFFGAMRIDAFIDPDEFKAQIDDLIRTFRQSKPAPGTNGPLIPGDPEREAFASRSIDGIPLLPAVVEDLRVVAHGIGVAFA